METLKDATESKKIYKPGKGNVLMMSREYAEMLVEKNIELRGEVKLLLSAIEEAAYLLHLNLDEKDEPDAEQNARRRIIDAYQAVKN